jgi:MYXO-CTERM domain-containing protein
LVLGLAGSAGAASISYFLDQSNDPEGHLADGTNYLKVTLTDDGDDIDVTVELLGPLTSIADANFGIARFMFNSTNVLSAANITGLPGDWSTDFDYDAGPPHLVGGGFGRFEIELAAGTRQSPTLYVVLSTNSAQGDSYFAAHVAGFTDQDPEDWPIGDPPDGEGLCPVDAEGNYTPECNILTSAWFGGTTQVVVPEPATSWLLAPAALVLLGARRKRR